jgi:NTE family protein
MRLASPGTDPRQELSAIGRAAAEASTLAEDVYLGLFGTLDGTAWPAAFRCTAIDADTGDLVVWNQESGVPLVDAVAASCVIPMLFPIVTIKGRRYMDGGILSHLNATAVPPTDVVVVLSAHPLGCHGARLDRGLAASDATANAELAQLRETRQLVAIEPDFSDLKATEDQMMDPDVAIRALQIGKQQAEREAAAIQAAWNLAEGV